MTEEKVNVEEIEQQENHLRSKYGNIDKRKGSAMLNKKLRGNSKKYFDSGDYNMERERAAPKLAKNKVSNLVITDPKLHPENLPPAVEWETESGSPTQQRKSFPICESPLAHDGKDPFILLMGEKVESS